MIKALLAKEYRCAFVEETVKAGIAFQVRALRAKEGWSQKGLGERSGKPQNAISRIEDPDYGKFTIRTLLDLADAFDVALSVRFVSFGKLLDQLKDVSPSALAVQNFEREQEYYGAASESNAAIADITRSLKIANEERLLPDEMFLGRRQSLEVATKPIGQIKSAVPLGAGSLSQ